MEKICFKCKTYRPELLTHPYIYTREVYRALSNNLYEFEMLKEFIEWSSNINNLPIGLKLKTNILFKDFKNKYPSDFMSQYTKKYFNKQLERMAQFEDLKITFEQLDGVEWFMLGEPKIFLGQF